MSRIVIKKAVLILDDDRTVLDPWKKNFRNHLEGVRVVGCQTKKDAWIALKKLKEDGYEVSVFIVDQVAGAGEGGNREWGISFLEKIKVQFPNSFKIMFTNQAKLDEVQRMLDQKLIHDFADKDSIDPETMISKIKDMLNGINSGNIQNPSSENDFDDFLRKWINSMPEQGDTILDGLDGNNYKAEELLRNQSLRKSFRKVFDALKLDRLADRSKK